MQTDRLKLDPSWREKLEPIFATPGMQALREFLRAEKASGKRIFPPGPQIFAALDATPFDRVKVVILGQDPYHGP
ncbi:MAG TPA: uracil-DNA glycosylase, partial [Xanthomonadales bacterium]|nr:uracil-DNA glycosylase [Xanthomonadales bacterium]